MALDYFGPCDFWQRFSIIHHRSATADHLFRNILQMSSLQKAQ